MDAFYFRVSADDFPGKYLRQSFQMKIPNRRQEQTMSDNKNDIFKNNKTVILFTIYLIL